MHDGAAERSDGEPITELRRTLGLLDLTFIAIGTVIGSGIFLVPGVVLRETGTQAGPALLVWIAAGVLSYLGALTYAEMGAMKPDAGGLYTYIRDAFGRAPRISLWVDELLRHRERLDRHARRGFLGLLRGVLPGGRRRCARDLRGCDRAHRGDQRAGHAQQRDDAELDDGREGDGIARAEHRDDRARAHVDVGSIFSRDAWPTSISSGLLSGVGIAMIGVLWAYEGWQYVTFSAGETRDPQRTFPRAISLATAALVALYVLANLGYIAALGPKAVAASDHIAADAGIAVLGPVAGRIVGLLILVSIFSAANGIMLTAPRMYFAMARDGVFFKRLAIVHPTLGTPAFAIIAIALWSALLASTGTFEQLLTYVVFTGWIFYGLGALSVFVYRRREPNAVRPYRVPGYPVTPVLFVASAAALVLNTLVTQPMRAAAGVVAVMLGTPAFYMWRARSRRAAPTLPIVPEL